MLIHIHTNSSTKLFHSVTSITSLPDPHTITRSISHLRTDHRSQHAEVPCVALSGLRLYTSKLQLLCSYRKHVTLCCYILLLLRCANNLFPYVRVVLLPPRKSYCLPHAKATAVIYVSSLLRRSARCVI